MGRDMGLNAQVDPTWSEVVLTVRSVRNDGWRQLAELHAENPARLQDLLDDLAAGLDRPSEGWDEAVNDFEVDAQLPEAEIRLDEKRARQLAAELEKAADLAFSARSRAIRELSPRQQERSAA